MKKLSTSISLAGQWPRPKTQLDCGIQLETHPPHMVFSAWTSLNSIWAEVFFFPLPFFLSYMQIGRKIMDNLKKAKQKFSKDLRARIERMVTKGAFASEECWEWKGATRAPDNKYGRVAKITFLGLQKTVGAYRASYMAFNKVFDLPEDISHTCHMGLCVNPEHPWRSCG